MRPGGWPSGCSSATSKTYNYYGRLRTWRRLPKPTEFVVRRFEPGRLRRRLIYQDFFDAVGIDARADQLEQVKSRNESLDAEALEFLRIFNLYRVETRGDRAGRRQPARGHPAGRRTPPGRP